MKYIFPFILVVFWAPPTLLGQSLYEPLVLHEIKLRFPTENWDARLDSLFAEGENRLAARIWIDGTQLADSVGVRYKGNSSYDESNAKNPFNIKLDAYEDDQDYQGFGTLKLANGAADPSFLKEVLAYYLGGQYMDIPRAAYAMVYINDEYHGLYVNVESIDKGFLSRHFGEKEGPFFKATPDFSGSQPSGCTSSNFASLEYLGQDSSCYPLYYEQKSDGHWGALIDLTQTLSDSMTSLANLNQSLEIGSALWMLAFNNVFVNLDSYSGKYCHNYYLYRDANSAFHPIIWDLNMCFGSLNNTGVGGQFSLSQLQQLDPLLHRDNTSRPLIHQLLTEPDLQLRYLAHMRTLWEENLSTQRYAYWATLFHQLIDSAVVADSNNLHTYADFQQNLHQSTWTGGWRPGLTETMEGRNTFLSSHPLFRASPPTLDHVLISPQQPLASDTVWINVYAQAADSLFLGFRFEKQDKFQEMQMLDTGTKGDSIAGDGIYSTYIMAPASGEIHYYFYAKNDSAALFSPRAVPFRYHRILIDQSSSLSPVVLNEIQASSHQVIANHEGKYADWVELYNRSSQDISLAGYGLSDDEEELQQWVFPDTIIPSQGYLLIWADDEEGADGLHLPFKLSKNGETVWLTLPSGQIIDSIAFPPQADNQSMGRYPNGEGPFATMSPSPERHNGFPTSIEEPTQRQFNVWPNPSVGTVHIESPNRLPGNITLHTLQGQLLRSWPANGAKRWVVQVHDLPSGLYILRNEGMVPILISVRK